MELNHIITQYRERRQYFAWEVYRFLADRSAAHYLALLHYVARTPYTSLCTQQLAVKLEQPALSLSRRLAYLCAHECLIEIGRDGRQPIYRISDFGLCVVSCIPQETYPEMLQAENVRTHTPKQHYDWSLHRPQIKVLIAEGHRPAAIAKIIDIKLTTLWAYLKRSGLMDLYTVSSLP